LRQRGLLITQRSRIQIGQRWQIERDGSVWTATEHLSPTALHVIVAHDLDALEQKVIEADVAS
jgi:hypothetical protein